MQSTSLSKKQIAIAVFLFLALPVVIYSAMQVVNTKQEAGTDKTTERVNNGSFTEGSVEVKYTYPKGVTCPEKDF